ncbi:MAG: BlaI/MecI/CopY family transcriptional regulator [Actinobacteria bacterium]|nr:BlaI/MecI/CopY family transcriptional regulator [Actinomycetota bacterium]
MNNIYGISKLEANVLLVVWDRGKVTNREVYEVFLKEEIKNKESGFTLYTTTMSTMNQLAEKKILKINRTHKTYTYTSEIHRKELAKSIISSVAEKLL